MNIKLKNIISITEARSNIFTIADKVQKNGQAYTFTENGRPKVVMMSAEKYEDLMEDLELMNDPKFMARMRNRDKVFARGEYVPLQELEKELVEGNLVAWGEVKKKLAQKK
ncbi:MAG: type II toxin-antitoxin system Phd/YefM family antitoxin [Candidatus Vogelbacteria bacterium]|nr:type II toxin-antitoxin system Phd/YefM family antitoxin [Candidatus Vogelbacteria bacterium]